MSFCHISHKISLSVLLSFCRINWVFSIELPNLSIKLIYVLTIELLQSRVREESDFKEHGNASMLKVHINTIQFSLSYFINHSEIKSWFYNISVTCIQVSKYEKQLRKLNLQSCLPLWLSKSSKTFCWVRKMLDLVVMWTQLF